jgi:hypothetical protein
MCHFNVLVLLDARLPLASKVKKVEAAVDRLIQPCAGGDAAGDDGYETECLCVEAKREALAQTRKASARPQLVRDLPALTADPDCEECDGTGKRFEIGNPDAHYDYWHIGGKTPGTLARCLRPESAQIARDGIAPTKALDPERAADACFAVVTADSVWHERPEGTPEAGWHATKRELIAAAPDGLAVLLDCHD